MNTQSTLTQSEIARIFMMYPGAEMIFEKSGRIEKLAGTLLDGNNLELIYSREEGGITHLKKPISYEYFPFKLMLVPIEKITDEHLAELWAVIGGFPHLFEHGKEDLRKGLLDGDWDESGLHMDYYTMSCMLSKCRELSYDTEDAINKGIAIDKTTIE
jgi:hypothetical protein